MSADRKHANRAHLMRMVVALVALSALAAFAIQAWFAYGFARHVWTLPFALALAVPVANDLYIVTLMVVGYLLRNAEMRVRSYIWCVLSLGIGAQIGAAWSFEHWRSTGAHDGVSVAALVPAALLAAALHSLIIAARHLGETAVQRPAESTPAAAPPPSAAPRPSAKASMPDRLYVPLVTADLGAPARVAATPDEQAAGRAPVTERPARRKVQTSKGGDVAKLRELVSGGMSCAEAASQLGRSRRWAELHTGDIRGGGTAESDHAEGEFHEPVITPGVALSPKGSGPQGVQLHSDVAPTGD
jgi:hypothetical protein